MRLIAAASVTPIALPFTGGTVRIDATLHAPSGESLLATAIVVFPDGSTDTVAMFPRGDTPDRVSAYADIPPNDAVDGKPEVYEIRAAAQTSDGKVTDIRVVGTVTVAAAEPAPPTPWPE